MKSAIKWAYILHSLCWWTLIKRFKTGMILVAIDLFQDVYEFL